MSEGSEKSGLVASGAMHVALLGLILFGFTSAPKFDDAAESIPVDTISTTELNEIMNGEKDAKPAKEPTEPTKAAAPDSTPMPPLPPEPPPDLRRADDTPPPPPRPVPTPPTPPKPPLETPPPKPLAEDAPTPPVKPKIVEKPPEKPREPEKPKTDELAKLLARDAPKEPVKEPPKPPARETPKTAAFDKNAIAKLIGKSADASPTGATSQGLPNHHAPHMSESIENALNAWFTDAYLNCWSPPPTTPVGENYVFDVRVVFNEDGSLSGQPVLTNPPRDPAWRPHAESAVRAVLKCNPLHIPPQYAPYFEQWRTKTIHFDPQSALG